MDFTIHTEEDLATMGAVPKPPRTRNVDAKAAFTKQLDVLQPGQRLEVLVPDGKKVENVLAKARRWLKDMGRETSFEAVLYIKGFNELVIVRHKQ